MTTARHAHEHAAATSTPSRVPPATEIIDQYSAFANEFATVELLYVQAITSPSSGTVTVTAQVKVPYISGSASMQVSNAPGFFPNGSTTPVTATATDGNAHYFFTFTGFSGNTLFVNTSDSASSAANLTTSAILSASVSVSSQGSAAAIFPNFITNSTNQMAINLVQYFNSLPLKLPYFNAPPHTPNSRGAIQNFVYGSVAGGGTTTSQQQALVAIPSLQQSLLAIPLPITVGTDLQIYNLTVASVIQQSQTQTLNGVSQVYARRLLVSAPSPANRYGAKESGTVPSYILAQP